MPEELTLEVLQSCLPSSDEFVPRRVVGSYLTISQFASELVVRPDLEMFGQVELTPSRHMPDDTIIVYQRDVEHPDFDPHRDVRVWRIER